MATKKSASGKIVPGPYRVVAGEVYNPPRPIDETFDHMDRAATRMLIEHGIAESDQREYRNGDSATVRYLKWMRRHIQWGRGFLARGDTVTALGHALEAGNLWGRVSSTPPAELRDDMSPYFAPADWQDAWKIGETKWREYRDRLAPERHKIERRKIRFRLSALAEMGLSLPKPK